MNHTPGPWVVGITLDHSQTTYADPPWPVFRLRDLIDPDPEGEEVQANRRLIAAAPDLLEACQFWMDEIAAHRRIQYSRDWEQKAYEMVVAAVAKAVGALAEGMPNE